MWQTMMPSNIPRQGAVGGGSGVGHGGVAVEDGAEVVARRDEDGQLGAGDREVLEALAEIGDTSSASEDQLQGGLDGE